MSFILEATILEASTLEASTPEASTEANTVASVASDSASAVAAAAIEGLSKAQKSLPPWLFYDEAGSQLFEQITEVPEYYLTRTERAIFSDHARTILLAHGGAKTFVELGAGTATKTGILLRAATELQGSVLYQPIDISPSALNEAREQIEAGIPQVTVLPQAANYITERYRLTREQGQAILALYIGSSIGNFSPAEARGILRSLRAQLQPGDALLLGTDLAPGENKPVETLLAAYDDASGMTAAFNRNILVRLNRELGANFDLEQFRHVARWNGAESRIEMHLESLSEQMVEIPGLGPIRFAVGETIHTENSYKFTSASIAALLDESGFARDATFTDKANRFAVTLAAVMPDALT